MNSRRIQLCVSLLLAVGTSACGGTSAKRTSLGEAGTRNDEGTGQLARASAKLAPIEPVEAVGFPSRRYISDERRYGGYIYGGAMVGGIDTNSMPNVETIKLPDSQYRIVAMSDAGSIAGTVTWPKPPKAPATLNTSCGSLPNNTIALGAKGVVRGAYVYLANIEQGKSLQARSSGVPIIKRNCGLWPAVQVVSLGGSYSITNDDSEAVLSVSTLGSNDNGESTVVTSVLQLGRLGSAQLIAPLGITQLAATDSSVLPASILVVDHPYITTTDANGNYRLDDLPSGTYDVVVWHPAVATGAQDGKLTLRAPTTVVRRVVVAADQQTRSDIALP